MFTPPMSSAVMFARKNLMPVVNPDKAGNALKHPAAKAPRIFGDSATRKDIEPCAGTVTVVFPTSAPPVR